MKLGPSAGTSRATRPAGALPTPYRAAMPVDDLTSARHAHRTPRPSDGGRRGVARAWPGPSRRGRHTADCPECGASWPAPRVPYSRVQYCGVCGRNLHLEAASHAQPRTGSRSAATAPASDERPSSGAPTADPWHQASRSPWPGALVLALGIVALTGVALGSATLGPLPIDLVGDVPPTSLDVPGSDDASSGTSVAVAPATRDAVVLPPAVAETGPHPPGPGIHDGDRDGNHDGDPDGSHDGNHDGNLDDTDPAGGTSPRRAGPAPRPGHLAWRHETAANITSARTSDGHVVLGIADGHLTALHSGSGYLHWHRRLSDEAAVQVTAVDAGLGVALATTALAELIAVDLASGQERWRTRVTGPAGSLLLAPPAAALVAGTDTDPASPQPNGTVLVSPAWTAPLLALDADTGELRWERSDGRRWVATPDVVVVAKGGGVEAWDLDDGSTRWRREEPGDPVDAVGELVVIRDPVQLRWLRAADGEELGAVPTTGAWWAPGPDGTLLVSHVEEEIATVRSVGPDGVDRWVVELVAVTDAGERYGCCLEVAAGPDGTVTTIDRRGRGLDLVLAGDDGRILSPPGATLQGGERWLVGAVGDVVVLQGDGGLVARSMSTGDVAWQAPGAAFVIALEPMIIATRQKVLAPRAGPVAGTRPVVPLRAAPTLIPAVSR